MVQKIRVKKNWIFKKRYKEGYEARFEEGVFESARTLLKYLKNEDTVLN